MIGPLNGAKGRLRNVLQHALYDLVSDLLSDTPKQCCMTTFFFFHKKLEDCEVWPMEFRFQSSSIQHLLEALGKFCFKPTSSCVKCYKSYEARVRVACRKVKDLLHVFVWNVCMILDSRLLLQDMITGLDVINTATRMDGLARFAMASRHGTGRIWDEQTSA